MNEVSIIAVNGRSLTLRRLTERDDEDIWEFEATLRIPSGSVSRHVYEHGVGLSGFLREVAQAWRGFDGVRSYASLEGDLAIEARHDGLSLVVCDVALRQPEPPEYAFSAVLDFGAGAHLEQIANDVQALVG